jgi:pimeloyl-ACP methyl ester carboxylesterase
MGGLLSKLQILDGGDRVWQLVSDTPIDQLDVPAEQKGMLRQMAYFERIPFVRRVVFMATPHRGASMATAWYSNLGQKLVRLPRTVHETSSKFLEVASERMRQRLEAGSTVSQLTGIAGLSPDSALCREGAEWPLPADVPFHSIIGNEDAEDVPGGSDGVVAYSSAHLEGAASEKIVKSGHSVQDKPPAIQELIRILREHLAAHDARAGR